MTNVPAGAEPRSLIARIREARAARRQRRGDKAIQKLRTSLDTLGITRDIAPELDHALRRYALVGFGLAAREVIRLLALWLWSAWLFTVAVVAYRGVQTGNFESGWDKIRASAASVNPAVAWLYGTGGIMVVGVVISGYVGAGLIAPVVTSRLLATSPSGYREAPFREGKPTFLFPVLVYRPAYLIADVIKDCANASTKLGEERIHAISNISFQPALTDITKVDRMRGTIPLFGHQRKRVRDHAARVVTRMHEAEYELLRNPDTALPQIAELWLTIAERYAQGRVGALLDEDLSTVEPARSWIVDRLRDAAAVVLTVAAVFFTASLELPQAIEGYVIAGSAVAVLILAYGSKAVLDRRAR
ncbi:hypothetical protein [Streptomyces hydrogenans]|uniref:hypothetical protein n=1 Tax=Streptomyces hydrogenans TaxID=1873719 RepID=UPI00380592E2